MCPSSRSPSPTTTSGLTLTSTVSSMRVYATKPSTRLPVRLPTFSVTAIGDPSHTSTVVPINYLLPRSPFRCSHPPDTGEQPSETEVIKALRAHVSHTLEVPMRLPSSAFSAQSSSVWYGTGKTSRKKDVGGYEVRRRDWLMLRDLPSRGWTCDRWDDMTAYMVRLVAHSLTLRISDPTLPGMHTAAIPHRRGHRSFRRVAPLALGIRSRYRRGTVRSRPMRYPPFPLPRQTRGCA